MSLVEVANGAARDVIRKGVLAGLRLKGDFTGRMMDPRMVQDPYPAYEWLRAQGPIAGPGYLLATASHAVCDGLLRHPAIRTANGIRDQAVDGASAFQHWLFSHPPRPGLVDPIGAESMIGMDGDGHARLRRATRSAFLPKAVEALRPRLTDVAEQLLATARREPEFDLMSAYAGALPVTAICELLGIPAQDRARFRRWGGDIAADLDVLAPAHRQRTASRSMREMQEYFIEYIAARRRKPDDGLLSTLMHADGADALDDRELLVLSSLLVLAGFETTVNLIGNGTMALIQHPDQLALLRDDPGLIPAAVDELLRYDAPIQMVARVAAEEIEVAGAQIPAGVIVSVMLGGANRDPEVFDDPERLDVTRPNARKQLSFAAGPHHCLGAPLARLEAEIAFTTLLTQLPTLRLAGTPKRRPTFVMRGYRSIPLHSGR